MDFERSVTEELIQWKGKAKRKPLLLRGARQVGKTTVVKAFARQYRHFISLNLERANHAAYFKDYEDVQTLVDALFITHNLSSSERPHTLLFIDEIQESPEAIALLRYFYEDVPDLSVIAAGSLLEHAMKSIKSFPVGRVEYLYMHPLNFREFLQAKGQTAALVQLQSIPIQEAAQRALLDLFHEYAIIGGMPEVVDAYLSSGEVADLQTIYGSIWETYKDDVEKYAANATDARIIKHIMQTAALYVDQRIKFENFGQSNYRSREVGEALRNLDDAKVIQVIYPTTDLKPPLKPDLRKAPRLQFLDTGLVNYELGIQADMLRMADLSTAYKGAIIPALIFQTRIAMQTKRSHKPLFWVREKTQSSAEVDLVVAYQDKVIPIEIKSGKEGRLRSLHQFIEQCDHPYAVRMYAGTFNVSEQQTPKAKKPYLLMNLPYFLATEIDVYIAYFVENYRLGEG